MSKLLCGGKGTPFRFSSRSFISIMWPWLPWEVPIWELCRAAPAHARHSKVAPVYLKSLDSHRLREIARLVNVRPHYHGRMVGDELHRNGINQGRDRRRHFRQCELD